MVHVRRGLGGGETPLGALGHQRREGHPRRHAEGVLMGDQKPDTEADTTSPTEADAPSPAAADPPGRTAADPPSRTADIVAGPGGVMTDEVGVVTGELTLRTEYADGQVTLHVQYREADEWYVVTGGRAPLADPAALDAVHTIAVGLLDRPEG
nr:hypothetical protein [Micromonospora yangpuensis]